MASSAPPSSGVASTTQAKTPATEQQQRSAALHSFLTSALRSGLCPDLELHAFGRRYPVHRLMLAQSPFFRSMLTGGWSEDSRLKACAPGSTASFALKFDDPNIGRTAFEYCLAALYGAEPKLVLPSWATPVPDQAFSAAWPSLVASVSGQHVELNQADQEQKELPLGSHVAHPRLLLSLLSTSLYLGIPAVSARALTLVLVSLTPWTVPMYLRYASGDGIDEPRYIDEEDEELDAPLTGFELGSELLPDEETSEEQDEASMDTDDGGTAEALAEQTQHLDIQGEAVAPTTPPPPSAQRLASPSPPPTTSGAAPAKPRFDYGTAASRIGEACACWLAGWGVDVLPLEEALDQSSSTLHVTPRCTFTQPPALALWAHPRKGGIPAAWVRGVISSDLFFVRGEAERWEVARRIVDLRRTQAAELRGETDEDAQSCSASDESDLHALAGGANAYIRATRTPSLYGHATTSSRVQPLTAAEEAQFDAEEEADEAEYAQLFAEGVYYTHMTFTELSAISAALSPHTGKAYTPLSVLQAALWAGAELKGRIQSASVGQGGASGRATSGEAAGLAGDDDDEPEAEDGRHDGHESKSKEAVKDLVITSLIGDFEAAATRADAPPGRNSPARSSRSATPLSSRHLAQRESTPLRTAGLAISEAPELGGIGAVGAALSLGGGKGALLDRRFFPVPCDDTLRLGESLISLASASAASALDNALAASAEEPQSSAEGPLGLAAAREASTLPLDRPKKKGNVPPRTPQTFFGVANLVRTGRALASESKELRTQQSQRPNESEESTSLGVDSASSARLSFAPTLAADEGDDSPTPSGATVAPSIERSRWTGYEPMRLGVEFYGVDTLVEKQRLYSPTFFYAGSIWNLYCQTLRKPRGVQLGVYLHRQSPSESIPTPSMPAPAAFPSPGASGEASNSAGVRDGDSFLMTGSSRVAGSSAGTPARAGINLTLPANASLANASAESSSTLASSSNNNSSSSTREPPAMPYRDGRKVLRAFFAIHCPSPLGSALTSFSSGPDYFSVSQSWGWKSSSLLGATFHLDGALGSARTASAGEFRCVCTIGLI